MSVEAMAWVWKHGPDDPNERFVLLAIADYAGNDGGWAWPSVTTLVRRTRLSESTVHRVIHRLVENNCLEVEERPGRTNLYRVRGVTETPQGCQGDTGGVSQGHPEPSRNHQEPLLRVQEVKPVVRDFEEWYAKYPKHREKGKALVAYRNARRSGGEPEALTLARDNYIAECRREGRDAKFIKYPASFLNSDWREYLGDPADPLIVTREMPVGARMELLGTRTCRLGLCDGSGWIADDTKLEGMRRCPCAENG